MVSSVGASSNPNSDGAITKELSNADVIELYNNLGEEVPEDFRKDYIGKIIKDLSVTKEETFYDEEGNKNIATYYDITFQDTIEGQQVKQARLKNQLFSKETMNSTSHKEGDVRTIIRFEPLKDTAVFSSISKNYYAVLATKTFTKYFALMSGFMTSQPLVGLLIGYVADDIISNGIEGKGDATGYERIVVKAGEVYHNNQWKTYYESLTKETYWSLEATTYNENGSVRYVQRTYYWPDGMGYLPINELKGGDFDNRLRIMDVAVYQYGFEPERPRPVTDTYKYESSRKDWAEKRTKNYN